MELIVVIGIVCILMAFVVPAIGGAKRGMDLWTGSTRFLDQFEIARQTACARNLPVEMRFYCTDETVPDAVALYLVLADGSSRAFQKRSKLPDTVKVSRSDIYSSLLSACGTAVIKSGDNAKSQSFRFLPNGTTNLVLSTGVNPTLTIILRTDDKGNTLPANFVAIRLDSQTGRVQTFRP